MEYFFVFLAMLAASFPSFLFFDFIQKKGRMNSLSNEERGILSMINFSHTQTFHLSFPIVASQEFLDALNSLSEKGIIHALVTSDGRVYYETKVSLP